MPIKRNGKFIARPYDKRLGKHVWLGTFDSEREAAAKEHEYLSDSTPDNKVTINALRERWLNEASSLRGWKAGTRKQYEISTRAFCEKYGHCKVREFSVSDAVSYASQHRGQVPKIRSMFSYARRIGIRTDNPFVDLGLNSGSDDIIRYGRGALTEQEAWTLAEIAGRSDGPWHKAMVIVAAYTGMRAGELYSLRYSDIHDGFVTIARALDSSTMTETLPKSNTKRTIPLPDPAAQAIDSLPRRVRNGDLVFVSPTGRQFHTTNHHKYWTKVRATFADTLPDDHWLSDRISSCALDKLAEPDKDKRAKMPSGNLFFHELRHTCATMLLEWGIPHHDVAIMLGHQDNGELVMRTYGHPSRDLSIARLRDAYAANAAKFQQPAGSNPVATPPTAAVATV